MQENKLHATTILCVRKGNEVCIASDGQVSLGHTITKSTAKKIKTYNDGKVLVGFAGSVCDCIILIDKLEEKILEFKDIKRACYELIKSWRIDKYTRDFSASIIVADKDNMLILDGSGTILEPEDNIASVGSGSLYALSAAKALYDNTTMSATAIVKSAMKIAADICVYTNHNFTIEKISY
jgi:ATP-dependent HslUV protease subunit HslV